MQLDKTKIVTTLAVISKLEGSNPAPRLHQLQHTAQEQVKDVLECGSYDSNSLMETKNAARDSTRSFNGAKVYTILQQATEIRIRVQPLR